MDIKSEIKRCRELTGKTRRALSLELKFDQTYIRKVERGEIDPTLSSLRLIARHFREAGCPFCEPLEELLGVDRILEPTG